MFETLVRSFKNLAEDEMGAGVVEYALITAVMAVIGAAGYLLIKPQITQNFQDILTNLQAR